MADIRLRDVPELRVRTEQRTITASDIKPWLTAAMDRLATDRIDHWFVVYHGQFTEETPAVPVEVCAPVGPDAHATRTEPAHREAYVRLTKAQFADPTEVGRAFGLVADWVLGNGHTIAGAPREVYFTDFSAAADSDEVCDIAFPIA